MRMQIKAKRARKGASQRGLAPSNSRLKGGSTPLEKPRTNAGTATVPALDQNYIEALIANRMWDELESLKEAGLYKSCQ